MTQEPLSMSDNTQRIYNPRLDKQLRKYDSDKLHDAEQRETDLLNYFGITDIIANILYAIKRKFVKQQKTR